MKNIISKELAIKLRDIGFNEPCEYRYVREDLKPFAERHCESDTGTNSYLINKPWNVSAPTYEQAKIWFMENQLMFVNVSCEKWLSEFRGEVETFNEFSILPTVNNYYVAFTMAIEEAIKIKKANDNEQI